MKAVFQKDADSFEMANKVNHEKPVLLQQVQTPVRQTSLLMAVEHIAV